MESLYRNFFYDFFKGEIAACDQEVAKIVSDTEEDDGPIGDIVSILVLKTDFKKKVDWRLL